MPVIIIIIIIIIIIKNLPPLKFFIVLFKNVKLQRRLEYINPLKNKL